MSSPRRTHESPGPARAALVDAVDEGDARSGDPAPLDEFNRPTRPQAQLLPREAFPEVVTKRFDQAEQLSKAALELKQPRGRSEDIKTTSLPVELLERALREVEEVDDKRASSSEMRAVRGLAERPLDPLGEMDVAAHDARSAPLPAVGRAPASTADETAPLSDRARATTPGDANAPTTKDRQEADPKVRAHRGEVSLPGTSAVDRFLAESATDEVSDEALQDRRGLAHKRRIWLVGLVVFASILVLVAAALTRAGRG